MARLAKLAIGTVGVLSIAWSGGWFYGESKIRKGLDDEIARLAQQGVAARYQSVEIGGFPFSYQGKVLEPRTEAISLIGNVQARTDWSAPWVTFDTSVGDLGVINFALPEIQTVRLTPVRGGPHADITIRSTQFDGRLQSEASGARISGEGRGIEITATSQALINPMELKAEKISIDSSAPLREPGQITAAANLSGLTANESIWGFFDPGKRFPRDPANLNVIAKADTSVRADNTLEVKAMQLEDFAVNIAGVSINGEGKATVQDRRPDGSVSLRFMGLSGLLENAANAGFLPEKQASLYSATIGNFARKGEVEGEQVFNIAFKGGYIYVNGLPTFMSAPLLP